MEEQGNGGRQIRERGAREQGSQEMTEPGNEGSKGTVERGNQGMGECGNQGTEE